MTENQPNDPVAAGEASFREWYDGAIATLEGGAAYVEEAAKMDLWLDSVNARQAAGLTQAQVAERLGVTPARVASIEKRGYEAYPLSTLRRYVAAMGHQFV